MWIAPVILGQAENVGMMSGAQLRLVAGVLAASYLACLLAVSGNFALPGLVLGNRSGAEIEWVGVSPLGVRVEWSDETGSRTFSPPRTWELAGGALALLGAWLWRGPLLRLILLQTAAWWFLLRSLIAVGFLLFDRHWASAMRTLLPALAGLLLSLWALARFGQLYVPTGRFRRAAAVMVTFSLPTLTAMVTLGRWSRSCRWFWRQRRRWWR